MTRKSHKFNETNFYRIFLLIRTIWMEHQPAVLREHAVQSICQSSQQWEILAATINFYEILWGWDFEKTNFLT